MIDRLHPEDLRAIVAAITSTQADYPPYREHGCEKLIVHDADALLAELANTAKPEPKPAPFLDAVQVGRATYEELVRRADRLAEMEAEAESLRARVAELEAGCLQALELRDSYHDWADRLAQAIAAHTGDEIGEHSSANNPWANALEAIDGQRCR